ncbi:hypothetical protein V8D89_001053 [Ganoderma adspersum]
MQASPTSCVVPSELQLDVVELLHDDERALRNCSLVCKRWAEYSRCHLWEKTAVICKDEAGTVSEKHSAPVDGKDVAYFFRAASMQDATAFFTANPAVAKLVRKFRIDGFTGVTVHALSSLLTALPELSHLEFLYADFPSLAEPLSDLDRARLATQPVYTHRLDYVYFHRCNIVERDVDMLLRVLGLFSSIDTLKFEAPVDTIRNIQVEGWSFDPATHLRQDVPHPPQPEVRRLIPEMVHATILSYLVNHTTLARNLKDLMLLPPNVWTYDDLKYMARTLLPAVGGTLDLFHFIPSPCMGVTLPQTAEEHQDVDRAFTSIAAACAGSVECLRLYLIHDLMPGWPPLDFAYVLDGFAKVLERMPPSAALKTFRVDLLVEDAMGVVPPRTVPTCEVLTAYDWPGLERVLLAGPRSEVVMELFISFVILVAPTEEKRGVFPSSMGAQLEFAKAVKERMPKLWNTGRLKVYFGELRTSHWQSIKKD